MLLRRVARLRGWLRCFDVFEAQVARSVPVIEWSATIVLQVWTEAVDDPTLGVLLESQRLAVKGILWQQLDVAGRQLGQLIRKLAMLCPMNVHRDSDASHCVPGIGRKRDLTATDDRRRQEAR